MTRSRTLTLALAAAAMTLTACSTADGRSPAAESSATPEPSATPDPSSGPEPSATPDPSATARSGSPSPADPPPASGTDLPAFTAQTSAITPELARRMRASHRPGCPVALEDLRYLRLPYVGFARAARTGELVVHRDVARDVVSVFRKLYEARWPIARMQLVDDYGGDDDRSMAADNTSAYNCRQVAGSTSWSEHAYGRAIDINPVENPYVQAGSVDPPEGRRYAALDRSAGARVPPGVVVAGYVVVQAFADVGWTWGGTWSSSKDYQHFSLSGR